MAGTAPSWPTLQDYTFDLSSRLRQAARSSLAQFEASINRDGYDWLNDYIDNIEAQGRRAPLADLIKTPSRTATAKKTRAMSAAKQSRAQQVQKFNLALSPFKSPEGRQPFSPLQVQPLNLMPMSPTRSPLQARNAVLISNQSPVKDKAPTKAKRGRPKKGTTASKDNESKENQDPTPKASPAPKGRGTRGAAAKSAAAPKAKTVSKKSPPKPVEAPQEAQVEDEVMEVEPVDEPVAEKKSSTPVETSPPKPVEKIETTPEAPIDDEMEDIPLDEPAESKEEPEQPQEIEQVEETEEGVAATETEDDDIEEIELPESPVKPTGPIRQVRSSWLTQALGTNTVPVSAADQKSVSASHRVSQQMDMLRQSHAAPGTLKRKSDEALDEREEPKRGDKMARFDAVATDASSGRPVSPRRESRAATGRLQGSKSLSTPNVSTPTSSFTATKPASSAPGDFESRIAALRERTAPPPGQKPVAPPANTAGFLGRLGNLVGISANEEEASRAKSEADRTAQENAEAELQRVLRELAEAEAKKKEAEKATEEAIKAAQAAQSRSNSPTSRTLSTQPGDVAIVVDDAADDMEVDDSIDLPSLPELSTNSFFFDEADHSMADHGSALGAAGIHLDDSTLFATSTPIRKNRNGESRPTSAMSSSQTGVLSQAERMAGKVLGVRSTPGTVKSLAAAEAAAKREQAEAQRRAQLRVQIEQKKQEEKQKALEAERAKDEEERRKRKEEEEERRRRLAKAEKARKEKMERFNKQNAAREQREAEARAKEEAAEAARKRKAAPALTKSQSSSTLTKSTASSLNKSTNSNNSTIKRTGPVTSSKEPMQANKSFNNAPAAGPSKLGPNVFRTAPEPQQQRVAQTPVKEAPVRPTLGPPVRTSTVAAASSSRTSTAQTAGPSRTSTVPGTVLQQSRVTLQAQLAQKALEQAAEDIVLPDIASEYSDSDDEEKETDFQRPAWAESPELKHLLEMQQHVNPDELFGPIRPLSMEELFQARNGKFRARTSSANWSGQDRLTETEERDYARRMGFRPINAPRDGGE